MRGCHPALGRLLLTIDDNLHCNHHKRFTFFILPYCFELQLLQPQVNNYTIIPSMYLFFPSITKRTMLSFFLFGALLAVIFHALYEKCGRVAYQFPQAQSKFAPCDTNYKMGTNEAMKTGTTEAMTTPTALEVTVKKATTTLGITTPDCTMTPRKANTEEILGVNFSAANDALSTETTEAMTTPTTMEAMMMKDTMTPDIATRDRTMMPRKTKIEEVLEVNFQAANDALSTATTEAMTIPTTMEAMMMKDAMTTDITTPDRTMTPRKAKTEDILEVYFPATDNAMSTETTKATTTPTVMEATGTKDTTTSEMCTGRRILRKSWK